MKAVVSTEFVVTAWPGVARAARAAMASVTVVWRKKSRREKSLIAPPRANKRPEPQASARGSI